MDDAIETAYRAARDAWPEIVVEPERFATELRRRLGDLTDLTAICTRDVYFAIACLDGNDVAAKILEIERTLEREQIKQE